MVGWLVVWLITNTRTHTPRDICTQKIIIKEKKQQQCVEIDFCYRDSFMDFDLCTYIDIVYLVAGTHSNFSLSGGRHYPSKTLLRSSVKPFYCPRCNEIKINAINEYFLQWDKKSETTNNCFSYSFFFLIIKQQHFFVLLWLTDL